MWFTVFNLRKVYGLLYLTLENLVYCYQPYKYMYYSVSYHSILYILIELRLKQTVLEVLVSEGE